VTTKKQLLNDLKKIEELIWNKSRLDKKQKMELIDIIYQQRKEIRGENK